MRKLLHSSWISLAGLLLLACALLYWGFYTEHGLRTLSRLASGRLGPITLEITGTRGTLAHGFHADRVVVIQRRAQVDVRGVDGHIGMLPLLWQSIHVHDLHIASAQVIVPAVPPDHKPWKPHILIGLLTIKVEKLHADAAEIVLPSGRRLEGSDVDVVAALGLRDVRVYAGSFTFGRGRVTTEGNLHAAEPIGLRAQMRFSRELPGQAAWVLGAHGDGSLDRLPLAGEFEQPFRARFDGTAHALTGDWYWEGKADVQSFDLRAFGASDVLGVFSGALQGRAGREGLRASGKVLVPGLHTAPLALDIESGYASNGLDIHRLELRDPASGARLTAAGTVTTPGGPLRLALQGGLQQLRWPLADKDAVLNVPSGRFSLVGDWPYRLQASGTMRLGPLPPMAAQADAQLAKEQLRIDALTVQAWGGEAKLHGALQWRADPPWQLAGPVRHLDVGAIRPGFPGRVDLDVQASGTGTRFLGHGKVVGGQVRGQRASGEAGFGHDGGDWLLQQVQLRLGGTRVALDGRIGAHVDLKYSVDASDLGLLAEGASGHVHASGELRIATSNPLWVGEMQGGDVKWGDLGVRQVSGRVDFDPAGSGHATLGLELEHLQWRDRLFDRLRIASTGSATAHQFVGELRGPSLQVSATGSGAWSQERWHMQFARIDAGDGGQLHFTLDQPAAVTASLDGSDIEVSPLCLHDAEARLCGEGRALHGKRHFSLDAGKVPMRMLTAGLVSATDFDGAMTVNAHGEAEPGGEWRGVLDARLAGASASHHLPGGRIETFSLGDGTLHAQLTPAGADANAALRAGAQGSIDADLHAQPGSGEWRGWPLTGHLALQTQSLGFIDSYAAQVDRVSGRLEAHVQLAGTMGAPVLDGELKVSDAQVDAYAINLALRELAFSARLHDNTLQLEGSMHAGAEGSAKFGGEMQWRDSLPWGHLHLQGEELRVVNLPEARVLASPDVEMKFSGRRIDVSGTIDLPYARLQRPDQLTNAVRSSADEVLVGADRPAPGEAWKVFSDVTLRLGDRVTIDTLGLAGRLSGSVRSVTDDTGFNRGTGELKVEEGKYTAYGRKLDIEHGRLQFSNGPINDPSIDLRAVKVFPDITAGVNVRGTLRAPRMTFFSDPPVAQSQIVSLLLAGGSLDSVQNGNEAAARSRLLLQQGSAILFQQLGDRVGLDDVSVESNLNNDTSLVLGRYLSPRLYVSYGVGLAEAINTIKMRYTIGDHWTIKTEAGAARSADLVFTIEH